LVGGGREMNKETTDNNIKKCLEDIKDICLVLTDPKEWVKKHNVPYIQNLKGGDKRCKL
jgi:hypothetical protein